MLALEQAIPQYLRVAPGVYYAGICDGVLQFTCDRNKAPRIVPERLNSVAALCRAVGYGSKKPIAQAA